ncbi:hypothetical protein [Acinetobacter cumulans]|uniref:hypothetical protein n=1 Tax=Acinetobacter cumulans TaxID=2136182 RepID=UPI001443E621|nr:hypothetical protein [Acinetobacter cumulans]
MNKMKITIDGNNMKNGETILSVPHNFQGEASVTNNETDNVKHGAFVRDEEKTIESLLLEYLKQDTPPEKIKDVVAALKSLTTKDEDSIYEVLRIHEIKPYLEFSTSLISFAAVLTPYLSQVF